jgi:hypothetical protein
MQSDYSELQWTETLPMRARAIGPNIYFKRLFVSLAKFSFGFGAFFFLVALRNNQVWHGRVVQPTLVGAAAGIFYRLFVEAMPAFVNVNQTRVHYSGRKTRNFPIAACQAFKLTPARGLLRFEFDGPRRRGPGLEHFVIAAPQLALPYLNSLAATGTLDSTTSPLTAPAPQVTSAIPQLNYQPKRINPYGGAFYGMGLPSILTGIAMLALPVVKYYFFGLPRPRLLRVLVFAWPLGLIFIATGVYFIHIGLPWIRQQHERAKQTRTLK